MKTRANRKATAKQKHMGVPRAAAPTGETAVRAADKEPDPTLLARIRARLPAANEVQRRAFRGQFPDEFCEEKGKLTKGEPVWREARRWAVQMWNNLSRGGGGDIRYA